MNFGEIKAFHSEAPQSTKPSAALNKQLQAEGLRQAAEFQAQQQKSVGSASVSLNSSQTTVGLKIYNGSMQQNVVVDEKRNPSPTQVNANKTASMFDFEKVAENVMRFVGGVIKGAAKGGADEESLQSLFEQARYGVDKGIRMAERDIGGLMNDDIRDGIDNSRSLLERQINDLEGQIFRPESVSESVSASSLQQNDGSIVIRTRDGDEVSLSFLNAEQSSSSVRIQTEYVPYQPSQPYADGEPAEQQNPQGTQSFSASLRTQTLQLSEFSIQIRGELDEDEMKAISDLLSNASDLADTFYRGDIETAFNQALELGYDKQELVGFALQLNRTEQTQVVQAYEYVQRFNEQDESGREQQKAVKPVAQYLDKMLSVLDQSRQQLQSPDDYNAMINGIVNEMKDVQVPDLVQAINRFYSFNQQLIEALPKSETATPQEASQQS